MKKLKDMKIGESILIHKAPDLSKIKSNDPVMVKFKTGQTCKMAYVYYFDKNYLLLKFK